MYLVVPWGEIYLEIAQNNTELFQSHFIKLFILNKNQSSLPFAIK